MLLRGVVLLRLTPGQQWLAALQEAVLQQLGALSPRDISQVCGIMIHFVTVCDCSCNAVLQQPGACHPGTSARYPMSHTWCQMFRSSSSNSYGEQYCVWAALQAAVGLKRAWPR
jgi:hypothetical protein